jgi:hypothetical protein
MIYLITFNNSFGSYPQIDDNVQSTIGNKTVI